MKIISVINPKGGAGKTVSSLNIAYALKNRIIKSQSIEKRG